MTISKQTTYEVVIEDMEYLRHGDKPFQARLFKPQGSGPFPVMVELHGGAWVNGTRENGNVGNEALARNGVIVAALDFRVPPEASYPASWPTFTTAFVGARPTPQTGTATRIASGPWARPAAPTRPCCWVCAPKIHATRPCPSPMARPRWTAPWAV